MSCPGCNREEVTIVTSSYRLAEWVLSDEECEHDIVFCPYCGLQLKNAAELGHVLAVEGFFRRCVLIERAEQRERERWEKTGKEKGWIR